MKEFLSQVPNLYVEDGAVCSGRCAELRIRSVTNDPVTAMAMKNMLVFLPSLAHAKHRMPKRDPMTPHPLSVIVARGMAESSLSVGMDPHSNALTVLATGDAPLERVLEVGMVYECNGRRWLARRRSRWTLPAGRWR